LEILHGDLDFNTTKRSNKEILRKIAVKESERISITRQELDALIEEAVRKDRALR